MKWIFIMQKFVLAVTAALGLLGSVAAFAQAPSIVWVATSGGNVPPTAVAAGKEANGQALFLCRAKYGSDNGVHPGKTRREFNGCNIGWGGKEVAVPQYEVAVSLPAGATWQPTTGANIPATAIMGGQEAAGGLAICRVNYQGGVHMGKTRAAFNGCNIGWGGNEVAVSQYEILVMAPQAAAPVAAAVPFMGCQQMSNTLGTNDGVTWGSANALQQQQWQANGCHTRPQAAAPVAAAPVAAAPGAAPTLNCRSGEVLSAQGCVSLAAAQLSINAGNAAVCTKNQTAYLANEEIVAKNKGNEIQVKIKAVEDEKISKDNKTNIDYAPNPKFDRSANDYQKNQLRLVLANNQQGAQDKIRALTNEQVAWTAQHKAKVENWLKDSSSNKSICP